MTDRAVWDRDYRPHVSDADPARAGDTEAARERLAAVNSGIALEAHAEELHAGNAAALLDGADCVVDGTDNFRTRYLVNDWAVRARRPWVYAGVVSTYGLVGAHLPDGPCLRCTWPERRSSAARWVSVRTRACTRPRSCA